MSKDVDVRGYRKLSMRRIYLWLFMWWVALSALALFGPAAIPVFTFMAIFTGWQMGVLTERNAWDDWFKKKGKT